MIRTIAPLLLTLVWLGAGCNEAPPKPAAKPPAAAKVEVAVIENTTLPETRTYVGEVRNAASTVLSAAAAGQVVRAEVVEGQAVKRGDALIQIDDRVLRARVKEVQAALERTNAELRQAERDAQRFATLSASGHATGASAEEATTRVAGLQASRLGHEAAIARLREEISQLRVVAPIDGVVARRHVNRGQWAVAGQPLVEIASSGTLEVQIRVPARTFDRLDPEAGVKIAVGETVLDARVDSVVGALDPMTRTALLRVVPTEQPESLREGASVEATLSLRSASQGVVVPADALVFGVTGARVFRVTDAKAEPHPVRVVTQSGDLALVASDTLKPGDTIVRRGNERLRPGQDLEVVQ